MTTRPFEGDPSSRHLERVRRRAGDTSTLYQITWDNEGNANLQESAATSSQYNGSPQTPPHLKTISLDQPPQQLSFEDLSPSWSYTFFLYSALGLWLLYLLLPRGVRKQYCLAQRKRYARRKDPDMPAAGYWLPVKQQIDRDSMAGGGVPELPEDRSLLKSASTMSSMAGGRGAASLPDQPPHPQPNAPQTPSARRKVTRPPSPEHPAVKKIPPNKIIAETMGRLQGRGIRLVAHGVHCDAKRVWIKLDDDTQSVNWQTEFPRRIPNQSGQVSIVLMRGSMHRIALCNVLYIDVGKKTNALQRMDDVKVPDVCCFSLLTQNGSLDLQANSKLERDALVSCFSMILDDVHDEDWRALYEGSPETSLVGSVAKGTEVVYQNPSDLQVEI